VIAHTCGVLSRPGPPAITHTKLLEASKGLCYNVAHPLPVHSYTNDDSHRRQRSMESQEKVQGRVRCSRHCSSYCVEANPSKRKMEGILQFSIKRLYNCHPSALHDMMIQPPSRRIESTAEKISRCVTQHNPPFVLTADDMMRQAAEWRATFCASSFLSCPFDFSKANLCYVREPSFLFSPNCVNTPLPLDPENDLGVWF